jgi:small subunit ribosomal protein S17
MSEENETTEGSTPEAETSAPAVGAAEAVAPAAPADTLRPKERRQRSRAAKASKTAARPARTPEERHQDRLAERQARAGARRVERHRAREKARAGRTETAETPAREHVPGVQKIRQGVVVSDRADKTITVRIDTARRHRRYQKIVRSARTLHAHDERNDAHVGDTVIVRESRPLSRTKRWRLVEVVERAK